MHFHVQPFFLWYRNESYWEPHCLIFPNLAANVVKCYKNRNTYLFVYLFQMPLVIAGCARKDFLCITFGCPLRHYQVRFRTPCYCISWTQWNRLSKVKTVIVYSYMKPCSSSVIDSLIEYRSHKPLYVRRDAGVANKVLRTPIAGQIVSKSCSFSPKTEFTPLISTSKIRIFLSFFGYCTRSCLTMTECSIEGLDGGYQKSLIVKILALLSVIDKAV